MKTYRTGTGVSNLGLKSQRGSGEINHIFENGNAEYLSEEEKQFRKEHQNENLFVAGSCKNKEELVSKIEEYEKLVSSKRNKYHFKETTFSIPTPENLPLSVKHQGLSELNERSKKFGAKTKGNPELLGTMFHCNEIGKIHLHQFGSNIGKDSKGVYHGGGKGGSISKQEILQVQRLFEKEVMIPFYESKKIPYISQFENKKRNKRNGKKISISEYKHLKELEEKQVSVSTVSTSDSQLLHQYQQVGKRFFPKRNFTPQEFNNTFSQISKKLKELSQQVKPQIQEPQTLEGISFVVKPQNLLNDYKIKVLFDGSIEYVGFKNRASSEWKTPTKKFEELQDNTRTSIQQELGKIVQEPQEVKRRGKTHKLL